MNRGMLRIFGILLSPAVFLVVLTSPIYAAFTGSFSFLASQRFFSDYRLKQVNGFSEYWAPAFDISIGLYEFPFGIKPILGFGYIQNEARQFGINQDGSVSNSLSQDSLSYQFYSFSLGARYKPWGPEVFLIEPYVEAQGVYRYGRVHRNTFAVGAQKVNLGGEFGAIAGGGLIFSFMYDRQRAFDMLANYGIKDFGLVTSIRYLPSGWFRHGLGLIGNAGGWDFGAGLFTDW